MRESSDFSELTEAASSLNKPQRGAPPHWRGSVSLRRAVFYLGRPEFVSEPIQVDVRSMEARELAQGAPSCPKIFSWRGRKYRVVEVLDQDKQLRAHDSTEMYVKSHSFRVRTDDGCEMVLRCDRQVRGNPWRVFTIKRP